MSRFVGGIAQAQFVAQVRDLPREQCLVVAVDVGKRTALALIADHFGMVIGQPVPFTMNEVGLGALTSRIHAATREASAVSVRVGVESAGHYHQGLVAGLSRRGFDVVELNPFHVKTARAQRGQAGIKTDERDCMAMIDLLVRGQGWPLHRGEDAMAEQLAWATHRRRKARAIQALGGQVHALADVAFPGLTDCFRTGLEAKTLRMLLATIPTPAVVAAMSDEKLVRHAGENQVRMLRPKAREVIAAAQVAMCVAERQRAVAATQLARDIHIYCELLQELSICDQQLARVLPETPAEVLTTIPGVSVTTASMYGAALGDPHRFTNADAAYRFAGLAPVLYESAGRRVGNAHISKVGSVELREAIIGLGNSVALHHPDFAAYRRRLVETRKKKKMVAAIAVGHRAHRLAFAMMRSQRPYDAHTWLQATTRPERRDRPVMATQEATSPT